VADVVHQSGRGQFVLTRMEVGQEGSRLQGVVELGHGDAGAQQVVGPGGQHLQHGPDVEILEHGAILPLLQVR
jgi:hypothetical protein